ncbi:MAG: hypothetical protein KAS32_02420 [Candidatus Peribacteraceae bacterium]|nr:hypothetical protein [Candidatus Peribacteraceae bacterium]
MTKNTSRLYSCNECDASCQMLLADAGTKLPTYCAFSGSNRAAWKLVKEVNKIEQKK